MIVARGSMAAHLASQPGAEARATLSERLDRGRRWRFVGREAELELLRDALTVDESAFAVLFLHGPGGIGKSALLDRMASLAEECGVGAIRLDLRATDPSPLAVLAAMSAAVGVADGGDVFDAIGDGRRRVLFLDTYEAAAPLDAWVRTELLPSLPAGTLAVIAGRNPPEPPWLADAGWRGLLRTVSLRNLAPAAARDYLAREGVPGALQDSAVALTHGHPLALSLIAQLIAQQVERGDPPRLPDLGDEPNLVRRLLAALVEELPSELHLRALHVCAHARYTTRDLLREALGAEIPAELFAWMRELSFIEEAAAGIFPHDLARDVLDADLRWGDPAAYEDLHRRIYAYLSRRARDLAGAERQQAIMDWNFLMRSNPFTAGFIDWRSYGTVYYDRLRPTDREPILAMVRRHEGPVSSTLVAHWLERQPNAFRVLRGGDREPIGFGAVLALHDASAADIAADPGAAAMWAYAQGHGAPRPGEEVYASRFYIDRDTYQDPSASYNTIIAAWIEKLLERDCPAWEFLGFWADPERIEPFMSYIDFHRTPEADFEVGGRRYGVFAHDWRQVGLDNWLELAARRQLEGGFDPVAIAPPAAVVALSAPDFQAAVRQALRDLHRPLALAANPLLDSRVVRERGEADRAAALQELIEEAAAALRGDPRDEKLYRALARTYLRPAPTQELAAEALDLPLSTYKRHRKRAVERIVAWLWQRELYGVQRTEYPRH